MTTGSTMFHLREVHMMKMGSIHTIDGKYIASTLGSANPSEGLQKC
jgi:hypothetical protein